METKSDECPDMLRDDFYRTMSIKVVLIDKTRQNNQQKNDNTTQKWEAACGKTGFTFVEVWEADVCGFSLFYRHWAAGNIQSVAPYIARVNFNKIMKWK